MDAGADAFQGEVGTSEEEREQIGQTVPLPDTTPSIDLDLIASNLKDFDECQPRSPKGAGTMQCNLSVFDTLLKFKPFNYFGPSCFKFLKQAIRFMWCSNWHLSRNLSGVAALPFNLQSSILEAEENEWRLEFS